MDKKAVGARLKALRKAKGLTQREAAEAVGITLSSLIQYESGLKTPRDDTKVRISHFYNESVQAIFFDHNTHCE